MLFLLGSLVHSSLFGPKLLLCLDVAQGTKNGVEQMVSKAHHSASRHITMHQLCFALQSLFLQKNMRTHAYTSLDQLVRNADQLITAKKRIEGVHHGASVAHHDTSRFTLDAICSIPFLFPRVAVLFRCLHSFALMLLWWHCR